MKKNIFFRFDADFGNRAGLGHFYRSFKIFNMLKHRFKNAKFFILTRENKESLNIIKAKFDIPIINYDKEFFKKYKFVKDSDIFIIDTLGKDLKLIKFLSNLNAKLILFDHIDKKYIKNALIINGIFFAKKKLNFNSNKIKILQSPKYILLNKDYIIKKKYTAKKICKVVVASGGADKKNLLYSVSKVLLKLNIKKIIVIIGKGVLAKNKIFSLEKEKTINLIRNSENIKKYFDMGDANLVSGGTVMFESIATGKPTIVIKNYEHQKFAIDFFKKNKNIYSFTSISKLNSRKVDFFLKLAEKNYLKIYKKNVSTIDGLGINRINDALFKFINK